MKFPVTRSDIGELLNDLDLLDTAVEVGVFRGHFAREILDWGVKHLYLVDLWSHVDGGRAETALSNDELERAFGETKSRVGKDQDRVTYLRGRSVAMAERIPDGCDFVYIDADHSEEACLADLRAYWPKVRSGGVMAGHDYVKGVGVRRAVNTFAAEHRLPVHLAIVHPNDISYWMIKP